jgi:hypothetical protein
MNMAVSKKTIGLYSIAGIAIASILIISFLVSGLNPLIISNNQNNNQGNGFLSVSIKDAPVELEKLMLTITGIYVQGENEDGDSWKELTLIKDQSEVTFDLLALRDISLKVSDTQLPAGDYNKIRLEVDSAIAVYPKDDKGVNPEVMLKVPPGHIDIIAKFTIKENQETKLLIDIQPDMISISKSGNFRPTIKTSIISDGPTITPTPSPALDSSVTPMSSTTPDSSVSPTPSPTPDSSVTPTPLPTP